MGQVSDFLTPTRASWVECLASGFGTQNVAGIWRRVRGESSFSASQIKKNNVGTGTVAWYVKPIPALLASHMVASLSPSCLTSNPVLLHPGRAVRNG